MNQKTTLLVPVLNEENTLQSILDVVEGLDFVDEVIFIDDGSKDKTNSILKAQTLKNSEKYKLITHQVNKGKGAAIRSGIEEATGNFMFIQDADLEYDPRELKDFLAPLHSGEVDVMYGSRFRKKNPNLYWTYLLGNKIMTNVINFIGRGDLTDSYTCYKGMSIDKWRALKLTSTGFEIEAEITTKCLMAKWKMKEVSITYAPRTFQAGKKIRGKDAIKGILTALKLRLANDYPR